MGLALDADELILDKAFDDERFAIDGVVTRANATLDAERASREGTDCTACGSTLANCRSLAPSGCCGLHDHTPAERAPVAPHPDENHEFRTACLRCGEPGSLFVSVLAPGETMTLNPAPAALAPATPADRVEAPRDQPRSPTPDAQRGETAPVHVAAMAAKPQHRRGPHRHGTRRSR
jgi:hypothetical protein